MNSTSRRIKFDTQTIDLFWLMGFAVWAAIDLYGPAVAQFLKTGMSIDTLLNEDPDLWPDLTAFRHLRTAPWNPP